MDFGFHVVPAVALTTDLLFFSPPYIIAAAPAFVLAAVLAFSYWFWTELCYSHNAFYPYPVFHMLNTTNRMLLFAAAAGIFFVALSSLKYVYKVINGREIVDLDGNARIGEVRKAQ